MRRRAFLPLVLISLTACECEFEANNNGNALKGFEFGPVQVIANGDFSFSKGVESIAATATMEELLNRGARVTDSGMIIRVVLKEETKSARIDEAVISVEAAGFSKGFDFATAFGVKQLARSKIALARDIARAVAQSLTNQYRVRREYSGK